MTRLDRNRVNSMRCSTHDYGKPGSYFITTCTLGRRHFFGEVVRDVMVHSPAGIIADRFGREIPVHFPFVSLDAFAVMPNHIHMLLTIGCKEDPSDIDEYHAMPWQSYSREIRRMRNQGEHTVSSIFGSFKSICSRTIRREYPELGFGWQARFHDHIVRDDEEYRKIFRYILANPKNWDKDRLRHPGRL